MDAKKLIITIAIVTVVGAGVVSAQPERPDQGRNGLIRAAIQAAGEETGLEAQEIVRQMREGMTLAEVVAANGGDVQTVIDQAVAAASERLAQAVENDRITQEQSDEWLSQIETLITEGVNRELPGRPGIREIVRNGAQVVLQSVTAATGLSAAELRPMLREGMTLAEIVTANGGDVQAVIADAVSDATARINEAVANGQLTQERADEMLANLETSFANAMNDTPRQRRVEARVGAGVVELAAEQTGLSPREIAAQLRSGTTLGELLTANGVDVNAFIDDVVEQADARLDQAVANGRITQERADEMLANLREHLTQRLNSTNPL
jgi:truncated hemoglobin YjbI